MLKSEKSAHTSAPAEAHEPTDQAKTSEEALEAAETDQEAQCVAEDLAALRQELAEVRKQSEHHLDQWKRSAASLENYRKHVEKERAELVKLTKANVIAQLLPVLDDLERAFMTIPFDLASFTWTEGLALIDRKLQLALERQGLEEIKTLGEPFDPTLHQALLDEETGEYPDGHVMAILQKGYKLDDRILRPALVKIARKTAAGEKPSRSEDKEQAEEQSTSKGAASAAEDSAQGN